MDGILREQLTQYVAEIDALILKLQGSSVSYTDAVMVYSGVSSRLKALLGLPQTQAANGLKNDLTVYVNEMDAVLGRLQNLYFPFPDVECAYSEADSRLKSILHTAA